MEAQINQIFQIIETAENREISKIAAETLANKCLDNPFTIYIIFKNFLLYSNKGKLRVFDDAGFLIDLILEEMDKETIKKLFETEYFKECIKQVYEDNKIFYSFDNVNYAFQPLENINIMAFDILNKVNFESIEGLYSNKAEDWTNGNSEGEKGAEGFGKMDLEILFPMKDEIKQEIEQCFNMNNKNNLRNLHSNELLKESSFSSNNNKDKMSISDFMNLFSSKINLKDLGLATSQAQSNNNNNINKGIPILQGSSISKINNILLNKKLLRSTHDEKQSAIYTEQGHEVEESSDEDNATNNSDAKNCNQNNNCIRNKNKNKNNNNNKKTNTNNITATSNSGNIKKRKINKDTEQKYERLEFYFNPLFYVVENFLKLNSNESWKNRLCSISSLTLLTKFFHLFYFKFFKISCNIIKNVSKKQSELQISNISNKKARGAKKAPNKEDSEDYSIELLIEDIKITQIKSEINFASSSSVDTNKVLNNAYNTGGMGIDKEELDEFFNCGIMEQRELKSVFINFEKRLKENLFTSLFLNSLFDKVVDFDSEDYICIFKDLNIKLANKILYSLEAKLEATEESKLQKELNINIYQLLNKAINNNKTTADWQPIFSILTFLKLKMIGDHSSQIAGEQGLLEADNKTIANSKINLSSQAMLGNNNSYYKSVLFGKNSFFNFSFSNKEYSIFSLIEDLMRIDSEEIVNITIQILDKLMEKFNKENYNSEHINISNDKNKIISIYKNFILLINKYDDIEVGVKYYFNCLHNFIIFFKNLNVKNSSLEDPQSRRIIENDLIFYALNKNKSVRIKYFNLINNILEGRLIYFSNHTDFIQKNVLLAIQGLCLESDEEILFTQKNFLINIIKSNEEACFSVFYNFSKFILKLILKNNIKDCKDFFIPCNDKFALVEMESFYSSFFVNDMQVDSIKLNHERKLKHMIPIIANVMKKRIDFVRTLIISLKLDFRDVKISKYLLVFLKIYYNYLELIDEMHNKTLIIPNELLNMLIDNKILDELPIKLSNNDVNSGIGIALKFFLDFLDKYMSNYRLNSSVANIATEQSSYMLQALHFKQNFLLEEYNQVVSIYNNLVKVRFINLGELDDLLKIIFNQIKEYENKQQTSTTTTNTGGKNNNNNNIYVNKIEMIYENFKIITNHIKKTDEDYHTMKINIRAYAAICLFNHSIYANIKFDKISVFVNPILNCLKINSKESHIFAKNLIIMVFNYTTSLDSRNKILNLFIDNCLNSYIDEINSLSINSNNNTSNTSLAGNNPASGNISSSNNNNISNNNFNNANNNDSSGDYNNFNLASPKELKINYPLKYFFDILAKTGKQAEMKSIFLNFISNTSNTNNASSNCTANSSCSSNKADSNNINNLTYNNNNININNENKIIVSNFISDITTSVSDSANKVIIHKEKEEKFTRKKLYFLYNIARIKRELNFIRFDHLKNMLKEIIINEHLLGMANLEKYIAFIIANFSKLVDDEDKDFDNSQIIEQIFSYFYYFKDKSDTDYKTSLDNNKYCNTDIPDSLSINSTELIFKILNIISSTQSFQLICINYIFEVIKFINAKNARLRTLATNLFSKLMKIISYLKLDKSYESQIINMKKSLKGSDNFNLIRNFVQQKELKEGCSPESSQADFTLCIKIKENLRYYQIAGIKWLSTLTNLGLGLALCDDMGLGKTIQTLCCIANETKIYQQKYKKHPVSLIVCPNTLILNWIKESKKFFDESEFKLKKFEGKNFPKNFLNKKDKTAFFPHNKASIENNNKKLLNEAYNESKPMVIYVTSYDKIREMDEIDQEFFYVILDEAHIIKNPKTKLYQNIKRLNSERRIILTGTPIQNNVMELWSLFDFLMPGFLGTENDFEIKFHKKIYTNIKKLNLEEKLQENIFQSSLNDIRKRIKPFILRRLKQDVLKELPDKIIQDYICEMTPVQKELYSYWDSLYSTIEVKDENGKQSTNKKSAAKKPATGNAKAANHSVLKIIDSMRKICNYPALLLNSNTSFDKDATKHIEKYKDKLNDYNCSGKLKALEDILISFNFTSVNSEYFNNNNNSASNHSISNNNNINSNNYANNNSTNANSHNLSNINSNSNSNSSNNNNNKISENKILIFSQYRTMLQIIKSFLETNFKSLKFKVLSSDLNENLRSEIVTSFNSDPEINILLLTTSIGGLGLSLTAANIVIMYDHDWNPMRDLQAMDRAHRLGQKKTVEVFR